MTDATVNKIVLYAIRALSKRHAVKVKYLLDDEVELQYSRCIKIAVNAFIDRVKKHKNFHFGDFSVFLEYLESNKVSEEISKLLDPGFEIFDIDLLVSHFETYAAKEDFTNYNIKIINRAWDEFLKAFSFASRSSNELREFLRAGYEAGSFRALSNVRDAIDRIGDTVEAVNKEEIRLKQLIHVYSSDLHDNRDWAEHFLTN